MNVEPMRCARNLFFLWLGFSDRTSEMKLRHTLPSRFELVVVVPIKKIPRRQRRKREREHNSVAS